MHETMHAHSDATAPTGGDADLYGTAIVDAHGMVRFCTAELGQILGSGAECVVEQPISSLIPELKLKRGTPGYNLAYALFWFPRQEWKEVQAVDRGGRALALAVSVSAARIDGKHHLVLALRVPAQSRAAAGKESDSAPRLDAYAAARGTGAGRADGLLAAA